MTGEDYFEEHGIKPSFAQKFGIKEKQGGLYFPVRDIDGKLLFHKVRRLDWVKDNKKINKFDYDPPGNSAALFNAEAIAKASGVVICEGEPDCVRLAQAGIPAVCSTSGAGTFKEEWAAMFQGKKVFICLDNDESGIIGTSKLKEIFPMALVIELPQEYKDICEYLLEHNDSEFKDLISKKIKENLISYDQLCDVINTWLLLPDKNVVKIVLATVVAHFFDTEPLWLFLVAPPSGTKTEIINPLAGLPFIHAISSLTPQTLISGMNGREASLLPKLTGKILTIKDFTTILSMREDNRNEIFSQLREIYDGKYSKAFGTGKEVTWEGKIGIIAGVTGIIDTYMSTVQVMGERFIIYRVPQPNDEEMAYRALINTGSERQMRKDLKEAFFKFFGNITIPAMNSIKVPEEIARSLSAISSFAVRARSAVVRDKYSKEVMHIPPSEAPGRLTKQLNTLLQALAVLDRRKTVTWSDYFLVMKVALDLIPQARLKHIIAMAGTFEFGNNFKTSYIAKATGYSISGSEFHLEDLVALGLFGVKNLLAGSAYEWYYSEETRGYLKRSLNCPDSELGNLDLIFPKNSPTRPLIEQILALYKSDGKEVEIEVTEETVPDIPDTL